MRGQGFSTGDAARLCSVNPDTVLKWIKKGRLAATRTAGGHYRIEEHDLAALVPTRAIADALGPELLASDHRPLRCWEYLSRPGTVRDECRKCVVYQIRAAWCFRVATTLGCELGQKQSFCATSCEDCAYYRRASGQATNVLVITSDNELVDGLGVGDDTLALRFARNAYEASAMIGTFHPAFVVVDQDVILANSQPDLLDCLAADPRLPGVRIILGVSKGRGARLRAPLENGVVSAIEKPFGQGRIAEVVNRFPVEPAPVADRP
jgi:excisionase family DNA binding protein